MLATVLGMVAFAAGISAVLIFVHKCSEARKG